MSITSPYGSPEGERHMSDEWGTLSPTFILEKLSFVLPCKDIADMAIRRLQGPSQPIPEAQGLHLRRAGLSRRPRRQQLPSQVPRASHGEGLPQGQINALLNAAEC